MVDTVRRFAWVTVLLAGVAFLIVGSYSIKTGVDARNDAVNELKSENITLSQDDENAPEIQVVDAETAKQQAEQIKKHTLERTGGKTYAELDREDPAREQWVTATALRTGLFSAAMALEVTRLVIGLGAFIIVLGVGLLVVGVPTVYTVTRR